MSQAQVFPGNPEESGRRSCLEGQNMQKIPPISRSLASNALKQHSYSVINSSVCASSVKNANPA